MALSPRALARVVAALVAVDVAAALLVVALGRRLRAEQGAHAASALEASNLRARADTTRTALVLADSSRVYQRQAVQQDQRADSIDRALRLERTALAGLRATVRELRASARSTGDVVVTRVTRGSDSATVRTGTFYVRDAPFTVNATATLPDSGRGSLDVAVTLDPIPLTVRPACTAPDAHGIRSAVVSVQAPPWARVELTRVEQDEGVCRSPALERAASRQDARQDRRARAAVVGGLGAAIVAPAGVQGPWRVGPALFVGLAVAKPLPCPRLLPGC